MVRQGELETLLRRNADVGHQPSGRPATATINVEDWKQRQVDAEQLQPAALEMDAPMGWIVDYTRGGDSPGWGFTL